MDSKMCGVIGFVLWAFHELGVFLVLSSVHPAGDYDNVEVFLLEITKEGDMSKTDKDWTRTADKFYMPSKKLTQLLSATNLFYCPSEMAWPQIVIIKEITILMHICYGRTLKLANFAVNSLADSGFSWPVWEMARGRSGKVEKWKDHELILTICIVSLCDLYLTNFNIFEMKAVPLHMTPH